MKNDRLRSFFNSTGNGVYKIKSTHLLFCLFFTYLGIYVTNIYILKLHCPIRYLHIHCQCLEYVGYLDYILATTNFNFVVSYSYFSSNVRKWLGCGQYIRLLDDRMKIHIHQNDVGLGQEIRFLFLQLSNSAGMNLAFSKNSWQGVRYCWNQLEA